MASALFQRIFVAALALIPALVDAASAQPYPNRPIRLIIPFAPGGAPDYIARPVAAQVETRLGQPLVIENRPGANGIVGMQAVANAEPDGYTLLHVVPAFVINPAIYKKLPFDIFRDFAPVAPIGIGTGYLLIVNPKVPAANVAEFIAYAKTHRVLYGSAGIGNTLHLAAELLNAKAGIAMEHVPFRGAGPVLTALLAGTIDAVMITPGAVLEHVQAGKLRALGFSGSAPLRELPDVPLIKDTVPGLVIDGAWQAWLAPAKTPHAIVTRINAEVRAALKVPNVRQVVLQGGFEPSDMAPADFAEFLHREAERYALAVRAAKIEPQ